MTIDETFTTTREAAVPVVSSASKAEAFTAFVATTQDGLYRAAYLMCSDHHRAQELTQQTFERLWRHWDRALLTDPAGYAYRTLFNLRIDRWRRTRHDPAPAEHVDAPVSGHEQAVVERDRLTAALARLPLKQRRAVVLRYLLDLSEHDAAELLDVTRGTVKSNASRGIAKLREILHDEEAPR